MATWRDKLGPAKFRDVSFFVESSERSGGRRTVLHEYPQRDLPYAEDLGRKARRFPVEGYVIGDDYLTKRDALLKALETSGPGELVHPLHGTLRVIVTEYRVRESTEKGGMAQFSIEFVETPAKPVQPTAVPDAAGAVTASATAAKEASLAEFLKKYSPGYLMSGPQDLLRRATSQINKVLTGIALQGQALANMRRSVDDFTSSVAELVQEPADLYAGLSELFEHFPVGQSEALITVYNTDFGQRPSALTSNREQEQANFDALQVLVQRLAVINAAVALLDETFDSYDEAVDSRDIVTDLLDEQAEDAPDDSYPSLLQLRADVVKAIPGSDGDLPRLVKHTPIQSIPSLVLAHRLYGNLDLESDLISRNRIKNPGFIRGGQELEVLSSG